MSISENKTKIWCDKAKNKKTKKQEPPKKQTIQLSKSFAIEQSVAKVIAKLWCATVKEFTDCHHTGWMGKDEMRLQDGWRLMSDGWLLSVLLFVRDLHFVIIILGLWSGKPETNSNNYSSLIIGFLLFKSSGLSWSTEDLCRGTDFMSQLSA